MMFIPDEIYYEKAIKSYDLGISLLKKYENVPKFIIESHNNIEKLRLLPNSEFSNLKRKLIIGVRKTHRYAENHKVSDFLVPYTSSRVHSIMSLLLLSLSLQQMLLLTTFCESRANVRKNHQIC